MKVEVTRTLKKIIQFRYEDGTLKVLANWLVSQKRLRQIIEEHIDWVNKQKDKSSNNNAVNKTCEKESDDKTTAKIKIPNESEVGAIRDFFMIKKALICGNEYNIKPSENGKTFTDENTIYICEKSFSNRDLRAKALKTYIKKVAQTYVSMEISQFGSKVSICPAKIELKELNNGWVRCQQASQKILCIDFRIAQLPKELRKYLIAHAFAHFVELTHDEKYWYSLSKMCPDYELLRKKLERYDFILDI